MRALGRFLVPVASAALLASCAETPRTPRPGTSPTPDRYEVGATVIENSGGPQLCVGMVLDSLPPQCGGPSIVGWRWDDVDGEQSQSGVTWGEYHLIGTYDGTSFTVESTGPSIPTESEGDLFKTPCPEPTGGWADGDPSMTGENDRIAAMRAAEAVPEFAGLWIDYIEEPVEYEVPGPYILNVAFTGDPNRFEGDIRAEWGGPLCLLSFDHTYRDLRRIQDDLSSGGAEAIGVELLGVGIDVMTNQVELNVVVANPEIEAALAEAYGVGTIRLVPALQPI